MTLAYLMTVYVRSEQKYYNIDWIKFYYEQCTGFWTQRYNVYHNGEYKIEIMWKIDEFCCGPVCYDRDWMWDDIRHDKSLYKEYRIENCSLIVPTPNPTLMPTMTPLPTPEPTPLPTPIIMFVRETCNIQKPWQIISMLTSLFMTGDD